MNQLVVVAFLLLVPQALARPPVYYPNGYPAEDDYEGNYNHKSSSDQGGHNGYIPNYSNDLYQDNGNDPRGGQQGYRGQQGQQGKKPGFQQGGYPNIEVKTWV